MDVAWSFQLFLKFATSVTKNCVLYWSFEDCSHAFVLPRLDEYKSFIVCSWLNWKRWFILPFTVWSHTFSLYLLLLGHNQQNKVISKHWHPLHNIWGLCSERWKRRFILSFTVRSHTFSLYLPLLGHNQQNKVTLKHWHSLHNIRALRISKNKMLGTLLMGSSVAYTYLRWSTTISWVSNVLLMDVVVVEWTVEATRMKKKIMLECSGN